DFSNPGMGMPPASSSPVLRCCRDEGDTATIPRAAPTDPRTTWRGAFRAVRAETERRALERRGSGGAVDARCEPDQVAPGAYHLVLRAVSPAAASCWLSRLR